MNMQQERFHKKQYNHAEYFSPEQIEKSDEPPIQQGGELWNVGIILYAFYHADFPFTADTDDDIIQQIITRNNSWTPVWREGIFDSLKSFIMMCVEADPYKRGDKLQYINHPYILQNHTPQELV